MGWGVAETRQSRGYARKPVVADHTLEQAP
jgi:hypothetical protein